MAHTSFYVVWASLNETWNGGCEEGGREQMEKIGILEYDWRGGPNPK
jgi:hypothetical protein